MRRGGEILPSGLSYGLLAVAVVIDIAGALQSDLVLRI